MKKLLIVFFAIVSFNYLIGQESANFSIKQTEFYGEKVLQVSSKNAIMVGNIQIIDSKQNVIIDTKNIELVKVPFYTTISINDIISGFYTVKIISNNLTEVILININ